jgi:hypothetical protein
MDKIQLKNQALRDKGRNALNVELGVIPESEKYDEHKDSQKYVSRSTFILCSL